MHLGVKMVYFILKPVVRHPRTLEQELKAGSLEAGTDAECLLACSPWLTQLAFL